jgi:hypothetical protein
VSSGARPTAGISEANEDDWLTSTASEAIGIKLPKNDHYPARPTATHPLPLLDLRSARYLDQSTAVEVTARPRPAVGWRPKKYVSQSVQRSA